MMNEPQLGQMNNPLPLPLPLDLPIPGPGFFAVRIDPHLVQVDKERWILAPQLEHVLYFPESSSAISPLCNHIGFFGYKTYSLRDM
jgi:hypothetical protein